METLFTFVGGIGLFLLGMNLLTDGLRGFAADWLRDRLMRFTGTPLKAFLSGAVATVMVQSSSATTVMVIGFVSAGLLTFPQALGIQFGASLGTTGTGWIVAWVGLKMQLGLYTLPLLGVGAFLRLLGRGGRSVAVGNGLVGFSLIFVGIGYMQQSMSAIAAGIDMSLVVAWGWWGYLLAVGLGILLTVLMQSSSAAVATTLTALSAGAIGFEHAAAVVIGAAIGTTVTGVLAAIKANVPARRTAMAHVIFNLATGLIALICLPGFLWVIGWVETTAGWREPATSLAAFHTAFIALGVLAFLPFVQRFAALIEFLVPDQGPKWTRHLDASVRLVPSIAIEATRRALRDTATEIIAALNRGLQTRHWLGDAAAFELAIKEIQDYLEKLPVDSDDLGMIQSRLEQMHAIDHLLRLNTRLRPPYTLQAVLTDRRIGPATAQCQRLLEIAESSLTESLTADGATEMAELADLLKRTRDEQRLLVIQQTALGSRSPAETVQFLDAFRWLDRVAAHAWRSANYLSLRETAVQPPEIPKLDPLPDP